MTLAIWQALWDAFEARASALDPAVQPADPVDRAIWWQLAGHPRFTGPARSLPQLQLPELHSGAPWLAGQPWVAVMTLNPAFIADESFPMLGDRAVHGDAVLRRFFDERFDDAVVGVPRMHGRHGGLPAYWPMQGPARRSPTWSAVEGLFAEVSLDGTGGLGRNCAIVDACPLKFRDWGKVPGAGVAALLAFGAPFLNDLLAANPPRAILAMGGDARKQAARVLPLAPPAGPPAAIGQHSKLLGTWSPTPGEEAIPVLGTPFPSNWGRKQFDLDRPAIIHTLRIALAQ